MVKRTRASYGWRAIAVAFVALAVVTPPVMADHGRGRGRGGKSGAHRQHQVSHNKHRGGYNGYAGGQSRYASPQSRYASPQSRYASPQSRYASPQSRYASPQSRYVGGSNHQGGKHRHHGGKYDGHVNKYGHQGGYGHEVGYGHGGYGHYGGKHHFHDAHYGHSYYVSYAYPYYYPYYYPFWSPAPYRIEYYDNDPFYFHSGFNMFFGGDAFWINIGNVPPPGYLYFDPYCSVPFANVDLYHEHIGHHHHPALIRVMVDHEYASGPSYGYYHDGNYYETYKQ